MLRPCGATPCFVSTVEDINLCHHTNPAVADAETVTFVVSVSLCILLIL